MSSREQRRAEQSVPSFNEHKDKFFVGYSNSYAQRWNEIFGEKDNDTGPTGREDQEDSTPQEQAGTKETESL